MITGAAGFIGNALLKTLQSKGELVVGIDDFSVGKATDGVLWRDVRSQPHLRSVITPEVRTVFHFAALSRIQPSFDNPVETMDVNFGGTVGIIEAMRRTCPEARLIYAASSSVWAGTDRSPYALSKHFAEQYCMMAAKVYGLHVSMARFYNVYGAGELTDEKWGAVVGKWRGLLKSGIRALPIVGDGSQRRSFTSIEDTVSGLLLIHRAAMGSGKSWELASSEKYSIRQLFDFFKERYPDISAKMIPDQMGNYADSSRINNAALTELGWQPSGSLRDYVLSLSEDYE